MVTSNWSLIITNHYLRMITNHSKWLLIISNKEKSFFSYSILGNIGKYFKVKFFYVWCVKLCTEIDNFVLSPFEQ